MTLSRWSVMPRETSSGGIQCWKILWMKVSINLGNPAFSIKGRMELRFRTLSIKVQVASRYWRRCRSISMVFATSRQKKRRCKRDMGIVEKMKKIPAAPSNLARWIDRNVMPHYLFYSYDRNQPETQVFCTYCEKFSVIKKPKPEKSLSAAMQTKGNRQSAGEKSRLP